jgi:hypothetical protein
LEWDGTIGDWSVSGTPARRDAFNLPASSGVINRAFLLLIMSDGDDSAALWKVNRTIHELVKDRVQQSLS